MIDKTKNILLSKSGATLMVVLAMMTLLLAIAGSALAAAAGASGISYGYIADQKLLLSAESAKRTLDGLIVGDSLGEKLCEDVVNARAYAVSGTPEPLDLAVNTASGELETGITSITLTVLDINSVTVRQRVEGAPTADPPIPDVERLDRLSFRVDAQIIVSDGEREITRNVTYRCHDVEITYNASDVVQSHTEGRWSIVSYE